MIGEKRLGVVYTADVSGVQKGLAKAEAANAKFAKSAASSTKKASSATDKLKSGITKGLGVDSVLGYAAAATAVIAFGKSAVDAYAESEKTLAELHVALKNSPAIVNKSTDAFQAQATSLEHLIGRQDEEVLSADTVLARMGLTEDQIAKTIPLVGDLATAMGTDMASAATTVGKAINGGPTRALQNVGIKFKATGDRAADLETLLGDLTLKVGGAGEAFGETFAGKIAILSATFDDLKEKLGQQLVPVLTSVADSFIQITDAASSLIDLLPGDTGLGSLISHALDASPVGMLGDALGGVSDLLHGKFLDGIKGVGNALIPFWDPFNKGADDAAQKAQATAKPISAAGTNADAYFTKIVQGEQRAEVARLAEIGQWNQIDGAIRNATDSVNLYLQNQRNLAANQHVGGASFVDPQQAGGVTRGGLTLVGERGPELRVEPPGVRYFSAADTRSMLRGAGGGGTTVNVYGSPARDLDEARLARLIRRSELLYG